MKQDNVGLFILPAVKREGFSRRIHQNGVRAVEPV